MLPADHYDLRAKEYSDESHGRFYRTIAADLVGLIPDRDPARILEVGCGSGFSTEIILARFPGSNVVAMDPAKGMLEVARGRLNGSASLVQELPVEGEFDIVVTSMSLHWTTKEDRRVIQDRLSPGGLLCIAAPGRLDGARAPGNQVLLDSVKRVKRIHKEALPETSRGFDCDSMAEMFPAMTSITCEERVTEDTSPASQFVDSLEVRGALLALFSDEDRILTARSYLSEKTDDGGSDIRTYWPIIHSIMQAAP